MPTRPHHTDPLTFKQSRSLRELQSYSKKAPFEYIICLIQSWHRNITTK